MRKPALPSRLGRSSVWPAGPLPPTARGHPGPPLSERRWSSHSFYGDWARGPSVVGLSPRLLWGDPSAERPGERVSRVRALERHRRA